MTTWYTVENGVRTPYIPTEEDIRDMEEAFGKPEPKPMWQRALKISIAAFVVFATFACVMGAPPPLSLFVALTVGCSLDYPDGNSDLLSVFGRGCFHGLISGLVYTGCSLLTGHVVSII